jgi:hypothetical protein
VIAAFAFVALAGFVACGDDELTVATGDVIGEWSGTTSQQRALEFTVVSEGVSEGQFGYQMTGQCNFTTAQALNAQGSMAISRGKFSTGKTQIGLGAFITISGEFTSSTTAKGDFLIEHGPCGDTLNINWTATKH